ncbi:hypothetical protein [Candidatus Epulonipiscium viviparus]|nr:hypothetical protein [Candidatus Epulopiscium viviparus]
MKKFLFWIIKWLIIAFVLLVCMGLVRQYIGEIPVKEEIKIAYIL